MFDPQFVDAVASLGALGFALIAVGALYLRKVRTQGEFVDRDAQWAERFAEREAAWTARFEEVSTDRDEWRTLAGSYGVKVDRLTDVVELLTGKKVA